MEIYGPFNENVIATAPVPKSWFDFLLHPASLEDHLNQLNSEPNAAQLLQQFVNKASSLGMPQRFPDLNVDDAQEVSVPVQYGEKKLKALRLLALKTTAFLKWDLSILMDSVPVYVMEIVLLDFLSETGILNSKEISSWSDLTGVTRFALLLYHLWVIQTVVNNSYPKRVNKTNNVQLSSMLNGINQTATNESVLLHLQSEIALSVQTLEKEVKSIKQVIMPTMQCFGSLLETEENALNNWQHGIDIPNNEILSRIWYDIGSYYFYKQNYKRAADHLLHCKELLDEISLPLFCKIDKNMLDSYLIATGSLQSTAVSSNRCLSLLEKVELARQNNDEDLVNLLIASCTSMELPVSYRIVLEQQYSHIDTLHFKLSCCNTLHFVVIGRPVSSSFISELQCRRSNGVECFNHVLDGTLQHCRPDQKIKLARFVRYILYSLDGNSPTIHALLLNAPAVQHILSTSKGTSVSSPNDSLLLSVKEQLADNAGLATGELERNLLVSEDPSEIWDCVTRLIQFRPGRSLAALNSRWEVGGLLQQGLDAMFSGIRKDYVFILLAKARLAMIAKDYTVTRKMLVSAESSSNDVSFMFVQLIRWEMLLVDLVVFDIADNSSKDISKKVKTCITAYLQVQDAIPRPEIIEHCAVFLLNTRDWDYLRSLANTNSGHIQMAFILANVSKDLPNTNSRNLARDVWNAILGIFTSSCQQKRSSSGIVTLMQRDTYPCLMPRLAFEDFVCKIKEEVVLSVVVSCLTKIYNILKDNSIKEVFLDYAYLWPSTILQQGTVDMTVAEESLQRILSHCLSICPSNTSWLRTQADLNFSNGQNGLAMKYYLQAGLVCSELFLQPVPKSVYSEQVFRRMIKCCSYMNCHTQEAVLCQFLDETDYAMAFKALQERSNYDAADAYYQYIFDITLLEFLTNLHTKRCEHDKKQQAIQTMGRLELNASNNVTVLRQAAQLYKSKFLRAMARQYVTC